MFNNLNNAAAWRGLLDGPRPYVGAPVHAPHVCGGSNGNS